MPAYRGPFILNGLGFTMKWNMGWMHDMLDYFAQDPVHRKYHHNNITFSMLYAFTENFVLPISHDEVVHGKRSLLSKMPGDMWQKFANVRAFLAYMYAHPGKKLLFMGSEIGAWDEWNHDRGLPWELLHFDFHRKLQALVRELNRLYRSYPAFYEVDFHWEGFEWVDFRDVDGSTISFIRRAQSRKPFLLFVCNFTPVPRLRLSRGRAGPGRISRNPEYRFGDVRGGSNLGNGGPGVDSSRSRTTITITAFPSRCRRWRWWCSNRPPANMTRAVGSRLHTSPDEAPSKDHRLHRD